VLGSLDGSRSVTGQHCRRRCIESFPSGLMGLGVLLREPVRTLREAAADRHDAPLEVDTGPAECKHFAPTCTGHGRKPDEHPVRERKETRRSGPLTWCFTWQPVRDSNPCRHLERATETVRLMLSDAVLCGLSRANATRRVASCRPISASTAAWSGSWIGKMSSRGEGVA
jgi:hypothetical protein